MVFFFNWVIVYHLPTTHLFRGTRNNYWLYHCRLPCFFHYLGEYGFTFFGGGTPFLTSKTDSFSACHDESYGCFFYVPARPKTKTCWVKRFSLWFLPFTHPPPCWKYKNESHKITASKYLPNFHWGSFVKFSDIKRPQVMRQLPVTMQVAVQEALKKSRPAAEATSFSRRNRWKCHGG